MNADEFRAWQSRHGLTVERTAELLGLSGRTVIGYRSHGAPKVVALACRYLDQLFG